MAIEVTILGSGSATPTLNRNPTAQFLQIDGKCLLIDCGEGTQMQLMKYQLKSNKIDTILISHLHGDHYFGLPGLLSSMHLMGRTAALKLIAPPELEQILMEQFHVSQTDLNYEIEFKATQTQTSEIVAENNSFTIESFPLHHRIPCTGYIIKEKEKPRNIRQDIVEMYKPEMSQFKAIKAGADLVLPSGQIIPNKLITNDPPKAVNYAFCSDTAPSELVFQFLVDIDCLYHEATFDEAFVNRAKETFHSTAKQAALVAKKARVKQLIIGHFSSRYRDIDALLNEAQSIFPKTRAAFDGMYFQIK
jgi:ribonuclease Z